MTLVLGIDTSTDVCAGLSDGTTVLAAGLVADRRAHAEQLMPLVRTLLAEAGRTMDDVTAIVVGVGPGPFTGLRVGVAAAATLAEVLDVPVRGVCSLDVVASQHVASSAPADDFVVVADARRKEVYWARYGTDGMRREGPFVTAPDVVPGLSAIGPGAGLVASAADGPRALDAGHLALVGEHLPEQGLDPLYLRRPDAEEPTVRKSVLLQPRLTLSGRR